MSHADRTADLFLRYGYDPDDPVPRDEDGQRVIPDRLLDAIAAAPVLSQREIGRIVTMASARKIAAMRVARARRMWLYRYPDDRGPRR